MRQRRREYFSSFLGKLHFFSMTVPALKETDKALSRFLFALIILELKYVVIIHKSKSGAQREERQKGLQRQLCKISGYK